MLGEGGFASVYRAFDPMLGREVALKALHPHLATDPAVRARFLTEARAIARLRHPNIAVVFDIGEAAGRPFIAMELIDGVTLAHLVANGMPLPLPQVGGILRPLAEAVDYLHGEGLVHRDIKPANVMRERGGRVVLMDFGIVRALDHTRHTRTGAFLGTPEYTAPEQVRGEPVGAPADIYALGVLSYHLLAGRPPFVGDTVFLFHAHAYEPPPPLRALRPGLPAGVEAAVMAALAKAPAERPASARRFVAALAPEAAVPVASTPAASPGPAHRGTPPRREPSGPARDGAGAPANGHGRRPTGTVVLAAAAAPPTPPAPVSVRPAPGTPQRGAMRPALALGGGLVLLAAAGIGAMLIGRGGDGTSSSGPTGGPITAPAASTAPAATADVTMGPSPTPVHEPTPMPTAAPVRVTDLQTYRSGDAFLAGQPAAELTAGGAVVACYGYTGAGAGTTLTLVATGPDGAPGTVAASPALSPTAEAEVRCEPLPGADGLPPGRYVVLVQDRGEERARTEVTLAAPPPPVPIPSPPPPPIATAPPPPPRPAVVTPQPATSRPATVGPAPMPAPTSAPPTAVRPAPPAVTPPPAPVQTPPPATAPPPATLPPTAPPPTLPPRATLIPAPAPPTTAPPPRATLIPR
jgi:serine/threonine-protein kinase